MKTLLITYLLSISAIIVSAQVSTFTLYTSTSASDSDISRATPHSLHLSLEACDKALRAEEVEDPLDYKHLFCMDTSLPLEP